MAYAFDPDKDAANKAKHGLFLSDFPGFDAEPVVVRDDRRDYGEPRFRAYGHVDGEARCLVFTMRDEEMRLISYRPAHAKELRRHGYA